jgi:hypothetical protein
VISLVCPRCDEDLTGLDTDAVFGCDECHLAWEPGPEGLSKPLPLRQTEVATDEPVVRLPFWRLEVEPLLLPEQVPPISYVYLPAFDIRRRGYFGDPGLTWTLNRVRIDALKPGGHLLGMVLGLADAELLARFYVLRAIDDHHDISNLELDIRFSDPTVIQAGFIDRGRTLVEPLSGTSFPDIAFCDLAGIRSHNL